MERQLAGRRNTVSPGPLHLGGEWKHGAQDLADGRQIVVGDPFPELE